MTTQPSLPDEKETKTTGGLRVLIHDYAGHPFQVQLSRELARRGYNVLHLYAASNPTPKGALAPLASDPQNFAVEGLTVSSPYERYSFYQRWRHERAYGRILANRTQSWHPDVAVSCNTPLDAQFLMLRRCRKLKIPLVFWVQDLVGVATRKILKRKLPLVGDWIGRYYVALEHWIGRQSGALVVITEDFAPLMHNLGISDNRLFVIENWAPIDDIKPTPRDNEWAHSNGLIGKKCFIYTGMIGLKHNPDLLRRLAEQFRDSPDVRIVVVSEGLGAEWLAHKKDECGLDNLLILGFQPYERLAEVLGSSEVLVAILEPEAGIFSVPSKVLSYLCAERPLLAAIPAENLAARTIAGNEAGLVADPGDHNNFLQAAQTLMSDGELRARLARNARTYAERTFDIETIATRFEKAIHRALNC